jgi:hypothetical protein
MLKSSQRQHTLKKKKTETAATLTKIKSLSKVMYGVIIHRILQYNKDIEEYFLKYFLFEIFYYFLKIYS